MNVFYDWENISIIQILQYAIQKQENLIMTFETEQNPLSVAMVEKIIEYYCV